jgi:hypothetical protein
LKFPGVPDKNDPPVPKRYKAYRIYTAISAGVWRVVEDGFKV